MIDEKSVKKYLNIFTKKGLVDARNGIDRRLIRSRLKITYEVQIIMLCLKIQSNNSHRLEL